MPHRSRYLFVCTHRRPDADPKGSCAHKGSDAVVTALKAALVRLGAAKDVRAVASGCLDLCGSGISVVQEPDHVAYGGVTLEDVEELAASVASGRVVQRLVVHGDVSLSGARDPGNAPPGVGGGP